jgi:hypothetical protein
MRFRDFFFLGGYTIFDLGNFGFLRVKDQLKGQKNSYPTKVTF